MDEFEELLVDGDRELEVIEFNTPINVYIKLNDNLEIVDIRSDAFPFNKVDFIKIDEGFGDKYRHAQNQYLSKSLFDSYGRCNYKFVDGKVVEIDEQDKSIYQPYTYEQLVERKIRTRYTVSDELAILRQRDTKPQEFEEYNAFCEQCKVEAKQELGIIGV